MHFKDKVAIGTGGSSGIGKETAKRLVAHGASVLIGGRDEAKLQSAAAELEEPPARFVFSRGTFPVRRPEPLLSKAGSHISAAWIFW
jgi:NAD(P)-dependent dehydrogenase (short-subunit alcohol dehydrogenase family)